MDMALTRDEREALLRAAVEAMGRAYAPYSRFLVGAAVLDDQGRIHPGCNVENAAYPQGVCAEGGALSAMVLAGGRSVRAVLVVGEGEGLVSPPSTLPSSSPTRSMCVPRSRWASSCRKASGRNTCGDHERSAGPPQARSHRSAKHGGGLMSAAPGRPKRARTAVRSTEAA
jgi:hypothetical protein